MVSSPVPAARVALVHAQTRRSLALAALFVVAAAAAIFIPHRTGAWLPLHLFVVGGLLLAISGATRLFVVTWSSAAPVTGAPVAVQRWAVAIGAVTLAIGRERELGDVVIGIGGSAVVAGLLLLGVLVVVEGRRGQVRRFHPALRFYVAAIVAGLIGSVLGTAMATSGTAMRAAHVTLNVLGLIGLVIAGTLPTFVATQARMKMSRRATPRRLDVVLAWLVVSLATATAGNVAEHGAIVGAGYASYALALLYLVSLLPRPGRRQLGWAGPRLVQLGVGMGWWIALVAAAAVEARAHSGGMSERLVVAIVLGGYAQILLASFAYLAPVLLGGGHERLAARFAATRSWTSLVAGNVGVAAWLAGVEWLTITAVVVAAGDLIRRGIRLR